MSNHSYLQGVAEALSRMEIDSQIKVASYNELEKVALLRKLKGLRGRLAGALDQGGAQLIGEEAAKLQAVERAYKQKMLDAINRTANPVRERSGAYNMMAQKYLRVGDATAQAIKDRGLLGTLGSALQNERAADVALAGGGALALTAGGLGVNALMDDEDELAAERNRNLALALGGTALAGGLGYGAYKAMS